MSTSPKQRFLDIACPWTPLLTVVFALDIMLLVLLAISFFLGPQKEGSKIISIISLGLILLTLAFIVPVLRWCQTQAEGE